MSVDALAVALRLGLYLVLMALTGVPAFALYALRGEERCSSAVLPLVPVVIGAASTGIALSVLGLIALAASMAGTSPLAVDRDALGILLQNTAAGTAWMVRIAALGLLVPLAAALRRSCLALPVASLAAGTVALATLAWFGHGAMDQGMIGAAHLAVDIVHLAAAGLWVGALLCFAWLLLAEGGTPEEARLRIARRALAAFAVPGSTAVAILILTGVANDLWIVGLSGTLGLPATLYGRLLIAKLLLFAGMLTLAAANRYRLTPALEAAFAAGDHRVALAALRRSVVLEALAAIAVLALVAWLGTLDPSAVGL